MKTTEATRKYLVTWTRDYQGAGESTSAQDDYETLKGAWIKADSVSAELGRSARVKVHANGVRINRAGRAK